MAEFSGGDELNRLLDDLLGRFDNGSHSDAKMVDEFIRLAAVGNGPDGELMDLHAFRTDGAQDGTTESAVRVAIRAVEIGSVMFAYPDPLTGQMVHPKLEMVRLAIPRRVYTQSHLDHLVRALERIAERREEIGGYRFTYAPELLGHFTARFEPV